MGVLWLIKAFPWNNQSLFSLSFFLFLSVMLSLPLSLLLSHTHMEGFRCHQSHLDLCMRLSANCGSMRVPPLLFMNFNSQPAGLEPENDQQMTIFYMTVAHSDFFFHEPWHEECNLGVLGCNCVLQN